MGTSRILRDAEGNSYVALSLCVKASCSHCAGCGSKEFTWCEHPTPRFFSFVQVFTPGPERPRFFGEVKNMAADDSTWNVSFPSPNAALESPLTRKREYQKIGILQQ